MRKDIGMRTAGIFAFEGGTCLDKVDIPIHFKINDMQVAEDLQLIVGHSVCNGSMQKDLIVNMSEQIDAQLNPTQVNLSEWNSTEHDETILVYGHFSTIHPGHIRFLRHAKSLEDTYSCFNR